MDINKLCYLTNNFFPKTTVDGAFSLKTSVAPVEMLSEQYFRIQGSILNDAVFQNTSESLATIRDEDFEGKITLMAVPLDFIDLASEITNFESKVNELSADFKGFTSESFGGYSYSISSSLPASMAEWDSSIKKRISVYRRLGGAR